MKKILALLLLLSLPAAAQYSHRSNPGDPGTAGSGISATGYASAICIDTSGSDTVFASITGTWVATLQFVGTNDNGATLKVLNAYPYSATGGIGNVATSTTANGDFLVEASPFRRVCVNASAFTSNASMAVRVDADPAAYIVMGVGVGFNGAPTPPRYCDKVTRVNTTIAAAASNVQIIPAVAGQFIYVCGYQLGVSTATTGTALLWVEGGGAACASGTATLFNPLITTPTTAPTTPNLIFGPINPAPQFTGTVNDALCLQQSVTTNTTTITGWISWTQN